MGIGANMPTFPNGTEEIKNAKSSVGVVALAAAFCMWNDESIPDAFL
jgi:hypothetical protein